jgi:alpha-ketoglutarate-dependent taurine dioxygenase
MIDIVPIEFTSIKEIKDNINFYKNKFIEDSVIVLRGANLTHEEHVDLHKFLGENFGWSTFDEENGETAKYIEDHGHNKNLKTSTKDDVMLSWHIEHVYYENPIVGATWNMVVFNTDNNNGKTYFVDSEKLYEKLPLKWKNFLNNCVLSPNDFNLSNSFKNYLPVKNHWITNNPVIRMKISYSNEEINSLVSVNDQEPTEEHKEIFKEIAVWFGDQVMNNKDIRLVHKWQKGDLVIPDMFKLAHAVTGGFDPIDRKFVGIWGYQNPK